MAERQLLKPGDKKGRLTIIEEAPRRNGKKFWTCRCECGTLKEVADEHLKSGHTKSCGCLTKQRMKNRAVDLRGRRFGRIVAIEATGERIRKSVVWKCVCDCGKETLCESENLLRGKTRSCGCLREEQRRENMKKAIHFADGTCIERIACQKENAANTSGHRGVTRRSNGRWRAALDFRGKRYDLGTYASFEEAVAARLEGEQVYADYLKEYYARSEASRNRTKEKDNI